MDAALAEALQRRCEEVRKHNDQGVKDAVDIPAVSTSGVANAVDIPTVSTSGVTEATSDMESLRKKNEDLEALLSAAELHVRELNSYITAVEAERDGEKAKREDAEAKMQIATDEIAARAFAAMEAQPVATQPVATQPVAMRSPRSAQVTQPVATHGKLSAAMEALYVFNNVPVTKKDAPQRLLAAKRVSECSPPEKSAEVYLETMRSLGYVYFEETEDYVVYVDGQFWDRYMLSCWSELSKTWVYA
jgi:hypothetical protein